MNASAGFLDFFKVNTADNPKVGDKQYSQRGHANNPVMRKQA